MFVKKKQVKKELKRTLNLVKKIKSVKSKQTEMVAILKQLSDLGNLIEEFSKTKKVEPNNNTEATKSKPKRSKRILAKSED